MQKLRQNDCTIHYCVLESTESIAATTSAVTEHKTGAFISVPAGTTLIRCINLVSSATGLGDHAKVYALDQDGQWGLIIPKFSTYVVEAKDAFYLKFVQDQVSAQHGRSDQPSAQKEFVALAAAVPEFSWPAGGEASKEALEEYLFDFNCLAGRVPLCRQLSGLGSNEFFYSESELGQFVLNATMTPMVGSGEEVANCRILEFCRLLDCLRRCSTNSFRLDFQFSMGKVEKASGSTSTRLGKRKRPDFLFEVREFLFMLGEGKDNFAVACKEVQMKLAKVPGWVFGDVKFLLAFAVAGFRWQLFVRRSSRDEPEAVGKAFDLTSFDDRVTLTLLFFKLYFVCLSMANKHTYTGMLPLFKKHQRDHSTIELDAKGCVKVIEDWSKFKATFGVALRDIEKAYSVKANQLVFAVVFPTVSKGKYMVRTGPLGLPARAKVSSLDDCKQLVRDLLTALAALHKAGLVHRDIRLDNVIWSPEMNCYVLIDLECVCQAGTIMDTLLTDYTSDTLVNWKFYTHTSDLYQVGVLMNNLAPLSLPSLLCKAFIKMLQSHDSHRKAQDMLSHAWLALVSPKS